MIMISKTCTKLRTLEVNGCKSITNTSMIEISKRCIHLESLDISFCSGLTTDIFNYFSHIKKLYHHSVGDSDDSNNMDREMMLQFLQSLPTNN